jgi:Fe-S oxidoreductase
LSLCGDIIAAETVWSCTSCLACTNICPLGVSPVGIIHEMRRYLVAEGALRGSSATSLQKTQRSGNPWGLPADDRFAWAEGLGVPTAAECQDFEVLYWIGCAAAYDRRIQKVARSVVRLLQVANVRFAVLGELERCSGETARRMGDEFLFQELAAANIESLNRHGVKKIVTHCPHCLHTLKHDYRQMGGHYEVVHHSELLADLVVESRLTIAHSGALGTGSVTYHDPCYLARVNGVVGPPRALIDIVLREDNARLLEMSRREQDTACCGAGGGRMWFDDAPDRRIGLDRVREALETGAHTVAVSCPFCMIMMKDGVAARTTNVEVRDVAEILADGVDFTQAPP